MSNASALFTDHALQVLASGTDTSSANSLLVAADARRQAIMQRTIKLIPEMRLDYICSRQILLTAYLMREI